MSERGRPPDREERDPYWQDEITLGDVRLSRGEVALLRLRLQTATERFRERAEIVPLAHPTGERVYVNAKPHILVPDWTATIQLYPSPTPEGAIGEVVGSRL